MRRLNRDEYEQDLRDILRLPHLDIRDMLPEDREAHHFNKVSETLDMSRVQLAAYLDASEAALRQAMATAPAPPAVTRFRASGTNLFPGFRSTGTIQSMFFIKDNQGVNVEEERWTPLPKELAESPWRWDCSVHRAGRMARFREASRPSTPASTGSVFRRGPCSSIRGSGCRTRSMPCR